MPTAKLKSDAVDSSTERGQPSLDFYRSRVENVQAPSDIVSLLKDEGIKPGTLRARNPITHDEWWIPVTSLLLAGAPYAKALVSVIKTWLRERKGRQVRLEIGRLKITARTASEAEHLLRALSKHEKISSLRVSGNRAGSFQKTDKSRKKKGA
jgi:hypothetical protein